MPNMHHPFDKRLEHRAAGDVALVAATALDTITERAPQRTTYRTVVNLEAIKISAGDESYQVVVELSSDNFATVAEVAYILDLGATAVRQSGAKDNVAGDLYDFIWSTECGGRSYQYSRISLAVAGTSPSVTMGCYSTITGAL